MRVSTARPEFCERHAGFSKLPLSVIFICNTEHKSRRVNNLKDFRMASQSLIFASHYLYIVSSLGGKNTTQNCHTRCLFVKLQIITEHWTTH